jgi:phosphoglycerate kinase
MIDGIQTLDDVDVKNKTVLLRVDINVPYDPETERIADSDRLREHAKTIRELSDKRAKLVILAHQGRKGDPDFIPLKQHAKLLTKHVGKKVEYVDDIVGEKAKEKIKSLKPGEIILLDNVRFLEDEAINKSPEEHRNSSIVKNLAPLADIFVNDAFSAAHRSHASLVGFTAVLPSYAGRVMEREITSLEKVLSPEGINVYIMGGAKPEDCLAIMSFLLKNKSQAMEYALTCGVLGEIFLLAKGHDLGKGTLEYLKKKDFLKLVDQAKEMLKDYGDRIKMPVDVAFEANGRSEISVDSLPVEEMIKDIGMKTVKEYEKIIENAKTIVLKGPPGVYEEKNFSLGTKKILEAVANSKAFTLVGGGDTILALKKLGIEKNRFSYVSLAGGALITYLSGKSMPAIEALKK